MTEPTAFDIGYDSGFNAALKGDVMVPAPPPFAWPNQPDFAREFAEGAALGFARGQDRVEQLEIRAQRYLDHSKGRDL